MRNKIIFIDTQIKKLNEKKYQILSIGTYNKYWLKNINLSNVFLPLYYHTFVLFVLTIY